MRGAEPLAGTDADPAQPARDLTQTRKPRNESLRNPFDIPDVL